MKEVTSIYTVQRDTAIASWAALLMKLNQKLEAVHSFLKTNQRESIMATDITLGENAYAVTWDPESGWNLYIPTLNEDNNDEMDAVGASLVAAFMRLNSEEDFVTEQLNWLEARVKDEANGNIDK
jgi:hypothetical protein